MNSFPLLKASSAMLRKLYNRNYPFEKYKGGKPRLIIGVECTFDDSAAAIVSYTGEVLGNRLISQSIHHKPFGGLIPNKAKQLHLKNVDLVIRSVLDESNCAAQQLSAVAVSVEPGIDMCLRAGLTVVKQFAIQNQLPLIPIHHMKAHALTARMSNDIPFPYLSLLISGGHCLIAIANDVDSFEILGQTTDDSPGELIDKIARCLPLEVICPELAGMSGGQCLETLAGMGQSIPGNDISFPIPLQRRSKRDCSFSWSGLKSSVFRKIAQLKKDELLDLQSASAVSLALHRSVVYHLVAKLERAILFCASRRSDINTIVVSGGVACNSFVRRSIGGLCRSRGYSAIFPPAELCTDNGIMIAWNGIEKMSKGIDIIVSKQLMNSDLIKARSPIGTDISPQVCQMGIRVPLKTIKPFVDF